MARPVDSEHLRRIYLSADGDGDGMLSPVEISEFLRKLGMEGSSPQELSALISSFSVAKHDLLTFDEFVEFHKSICVEDFPTTDGKGKVASSTEEEDLKLMKEAFRVYDENNDGFISAEEIQRVLSSLGFSEGRHISNCQKMICRFDSDSNGRLDFSEFTSMMKAQSDTSSTPA